MLLALYGLLLVVPSANYHLFDGVPLSRVPEFLGLALLAPFLVRRALRRLYGRLAGAAGPVALRAFLALGALALALKLVLLASGTYAGFLACYGSPIAAPPAGSCEVSYENPFVRFGITRIDRRVDFAPLTWDLSFVNSYRFNIYPWVAGNVLRDRLPLTATWIGTVERRRAWTAEVRYVGAATLQVDSMEPTRLGPRYDAPAVVQVPIPAGRHRLTVAYEFDDGSRVGDGRARGPYATFRLARQGGAPGPPVPVRSARAPGTWRATGAVVDTVVVLLAATLVAACAVAVGRDGWIPVAVALAAAGSDRWDSRLPFVPPSSWFFLLLALLLAYLARRVRPRRMLVVYLGIFAATFFLAWRRFGRMNVVESRGAGDDWLTYEALARSILEAWSLRAGEDVFYYQPFFRYFRFAEHFLLGDGDPFIWTGALVTLTWGLFWMCATVLGHRQAMVRTVALTGAGLLLVLLATSPTVLAMLQWGVSEYPTWIMLPPLLTMLFVSPSTRGWAPGAGLLGLSLLTRTNHLPGVLVILALFLWRGLRIRPRAAIGAGLLFGAVALLPSLHNYHYGGRLVPLTTSAGIPQNLVLPPAQLLEIAQDAGIRDRLRVQVERMLYVGGPDRVVTLAVRGLQVTWLVAMGAWAVAGRAGFPLALLVSLPAAYLLPHLFYQATHAYPRHFLIGYFAMGAAVLLAGVPSSGGSRRGAFRGAGPAPLSGAGRAASR
jgi:hypothetical protein